MTYFLFGIYAFPVVFGWLPVGWKAKVLTKVIHKIAGEVREKHGKGEHVLNGVKFNVDLKKK